MADEPTAADAQPNPPTGAAPEPDSQRQSLAIGVFLHMSETQANAWVAATEKQFAIPAQEETKRAREETKRTIGTQLITAAVVVVALLILMIALKAAVAAPNGNGSVGTIVTAIATVVGVLAAPTIIKQFRK